MSARWDRDEETTRRNTEISSDFFRRQSIDRSRERSLDTPSNLPAYPSRNPLVSRLEKHIGEEILVSSEDLGRNKRVTLAEVLSQGDTVMLRLEGSGEEALVNLNLLSKITFLKGR